MAKNMGIESTLGSRNSLEQEDTVEYKLGEPFTVEGFSDPDDLIHFLDEYQGDIQVLVANIRTSSVTFTAYQKKLIEQLEKEYGKFCNDYDNFQSDVFEEIVIELREDLIPRETLDPDYCEEQKNFYQCVHYAFERSSFPYSTLQLHLLKEIKEQLKWATGNLSDMRDIGMLELVQEFLDLMKSKDHVNNKKFYVNCAIEYHVQEIIDELYYPAMNEITLSIPEDFIDEPKARLATYVIEELKSVYHGVHFSTYKNIFHLGMSEIYNHIVNIFKYSGLFFSINQRELMSGILMNIGKTARNPSVENYADLQLGIYGFLDDLRRCHQERMLTIKNDYRVFQNEGTVARAVEKVTKDLDNLQEVSEIHYKNFEEFSEKIPDITKSILHHFLCIYPKELKEPVIMNWGRRFRAQGLKNVEVNLLGEA